MNPMRGRRGGVLLVAVSVAWLWSVVTEHWLVLAGVVIVECVLAVCQHRLVMEARAERVAAERDLAAARRRLAEVMACRAEWFADADSWAAIADQAMAVWENTPDGRRAAVLHDPTFAVVGSRDGVGDRRLLRGGPMRIVSFDAEWERRVYEFVIARGGPLRVVRVMVPRGEYGPRTRQRWIVDDFYRGTFRTRAEAVRAARAG